MVQHTEVQKLLALSLGEVHLKNQVQHHQMFLQEHFWSINLNAFTKYNQAVVN